MPSPVVQRRLTPPSNILFRDEFLLASIDTSKWTGTDTELRLGQAEECINAAQDPSFERGDLGGDGITDGWAAANSNASLNAQVTYALDSDTPRGAGQSQRVTVAVLAGVPAGSWNRLRFPGAGVGWADTVPGEVWSMQAAVKATLSGCAIIPILEWYTAANAYVSETAGATVSAPPSGWFTCAVVNATVPATAFKVRASLQIGSLDNGDSATVLWDDVLLCKKAYLPGPYFDGSFPGCSWAGAAHASTSLRPDDDTNLLTANQSDVETDTVGFTALAGAAIAQSAVQAWHGTNSLEVITPNVAAGEGAEADNTVVSPSTVHTAYIYLYGAGGGTVKVALEERTAADALVGSTESAVKTLGAYWQRVSVYRAFGATGARARVKVYTNVAQALTFYADGWLLTPKGYPVEWVLGGTSSPGPATPARALICRGGKATAAWDDPRGTARYTIVPRAGLTLELSVVLSSFGASGIEWGFDTTTPVVAHLLPCHQAVGSGAMTVISASGSYPVPATFAVGRLYRLRLTYLNAGIYWEVSVNDGVTWQVLRVELVANPSLAYIGFSNHSASFYLPSPGVRLYRRTPPGPVVSDPSAGVITPTLGGELLTDPGLEANYTAGLCDSLLKTLLPVVAESADVHGGAKAQSFTATALNDALYQSIAGLLTAGEYYLATVWAKCTAGFAGTNKLSVHDGTSIYTGPGYADAAYTQKIMALRATNTGSVFRPVLESAVVPTDTVIVDDMSLKALTMGSLFGPAWTVPAGNQHVKITLDTDPGFTNAGVAWYVDDNNWLAIYHRGGSGYVLQRSAGVYTQLATVVKAWAAAQQIEATLNGTSLVAYIGGTQIGGTLTVPAAIAAATQLKRFSTWAGNQLSGLTVWGPTS